MSAGCIIQARIKVNYINFLDSLDVNRPKHGANVSISQFGVRSVNDENKIARKSHQDKVTKRHVACKECSTAEWLVFRLLSGCPDRQMQTEPFLQFGKSVQGCNAANNHKVQYSAKIVQTTLCDPAS